MPSEPACCLDTLSTSLRRLTAVAHAPAGFPHGACHRKPHALVRPRPGLRCQPRDCGCAQTRLSCLQVGNGGLTLNEQRSHFALWSLLKSPLMVGTDLAKLPPEGFRILLAKEVIAVNQDPLGVAGDLVWKEGPSEVRLAVHGLPPSCCLQGEGRKNYICSSQCQAD